MSGIDIPIPATPGSGDFVDLSALKGENRTVLFKGDGVDQVQLELTNDGGATYHGFAEFLFQASPRKKVVDESWSGCRATLLSGTNAGLSLSVGGDPVEGHGEALNSEVPAFVDTYEVVAKPIAICARGGDVDLIRFTYGGEAIAASGTDYFTITIDVATQGGAPRGTLATFSATGGVLSGYNDFVPDEITQLNPGDLLLMTVAQVGNGMATVADGLVSVTLK